MEGNGEGGYLPPSLIFFRNIIRLVLGIGSFVNPHSRQHSSVATCIVFTLYPKRRVRLNQKSFGNDDCIENVFEISKNPHSPFALEIFSTFSLKSSRSLSNDGISVEAT